MTRLTTGAFLLMSAACSTMDVQSAKAPNVDLGQYRTYAWPPTAQNAGKPAASIFDQTVKTSVDYQMEVKGLKRVAPSQADLIVSYAAVTRPNQQAPDYGLYGWDWGGLAPPASREGTLTLQLVDPKAHKVVWNGTATDVISENGESPKQVREAVKEIFQKYG